MKQETKKQNLIRFKYALDRLWALDVIFTTDYVLRLGRLSNEKSRLFKVPNATDLQENLKPRINL